MYKRQTWLLSITANVNPAASAQTNARKALSQVRDLLLPLLKQNPQHPLLLLLPKQKLLLLKHLKQKKNLLNNPKQQNGEVFDFTVFLCPYNPLLPNPKKAGTLNIHRFRLIHF